MGVALWAICAETDEAAMRLSLSSRMQMLLLYRGQSIAVPTVEQAQRFLEEEGMPPETLPIGRRFITGSPTTVRNAVENLAGQYGAEEVFLVNLPHIDFRRPNE